MTVLLAFIGKAAVITLVVLVLAVIGLASLFHRR